MGDSPTPGDAARARSEGRLYGAFNGAKMGHMIRKAEDYGGMSDSGSSGEAPDSFPIVECIVPFTCDDWRGLMPATFSSVVRRRRVRGVPEVSTPARHRIDQSIWKGIRIAIGTITPGSISEL